jgi:cytochrome b561
MVWRNSSDSFGLISRILHWGMALLIVVMLALGTRIAGMQPGLANLWLYGLHKSLGLTILGLVGLRIVWHLISPPPRPIGDGWPVTLARTGHLTLYALLIAIPLSGWVASSATGIDVMLWDRWVMPALAPVSEVWEKTGFRIHRILTMTLYGLGTLHALAGMKREMEGDGTLTRMLRGRVPKD